MKPFDLSSVEAVAIGASAGGVEALSQLLPALPRDFRPAVLVVLHVRPDVPSLLPGLLGARCRLPVIEPNDKDEVAGGTIYIAPPGYHMQVDPNGSIALSIDPPVQFSRPSVDVLFESAAHAYGDVLLGIVLSGANDDGARGLAAIRRAGGYCWAQDPATAPSDAMPRGAIARGGVHEILTLERMAERLGGLTAGAPGQ
jgi:two-component system, chemotaxis family, protein-glutamate methylesterase/glutaminase